jgi:hypothetical protein
LQSFSNRRSTFIRVDARAEAAWSGDEARPIGDETACDVVSRTLEATRTPARPVNPTQAACVSSVIGGTDMPLALASVLLATAAAAIGIDAKDPTTLDDTRLVAPQKVPPLPTVTVAWVDPERTLSGKSSDAMVEEVDAVFRAIGIGTEVVRTAPGESIEAVGAIVVPVVALQRQPRGLRPDRVMGLVLRHHAAPSPAWVFVDNVRATLGRGTTANDLGTAVGRVVAHEVIHALAPGHPHASRGLMAPTLDRGSLLGRRHPLELGCLRAVLAGLFALSAARPAPGPAAARGEPVPLTRVMGIRPTPGPV